MGQYTQACLVIQNLSDDDFNWLDQHYAGLQRVIHDHDPSDEDREAFHRVLKVWWVGDFLPSEINFTIEADGTTAVIAGEEYANHQLMACLAQAFIQDRRVVSQHRLIVEYSYTADDPWKQSYGGGAWYCDGKNMLNTDSRKWLEDKCS